MVKWGGWGSNPRPADYEKCGPVLRVRYLHGYRRAVPPVALIAQLARMARSTNRSTPHRGDLGCQLQNVTVGGGLISGGLWQAGDVVDLDYPSFFVIVERRCTARSSGAVDPATRTGTTLAAGPVR